MLHVANCLICNSMHKTKNKRIAPLTQRSMILRDQHDLALTDSFPPKSQQKENSRG